MTSAYRCGGGTNYSLRVSPVLTSWYLAYIRKFTTNSRDIVEICPSGADGLPVA